MKILAVILTFTNLVLVGCGSGSGTLSEPSYPDGVWEYSPNDEETTTTTTNTTVAARSHIEADDHPDFGGLIEIKGDEWTIYDATTLEGSEYDVYTGTVDANGNVTAGNLGVSTIIVTGDYLTGISIYFTDFSGNERVNGYNYVAPAISPEIKQQYNLPSPIVTSADPIPTTGFPNGAWYLDNDVYDAQGNYLYANAGQLLIIEGGMLTSYEEIRDESAPETVDPFVCWERSEGKYDPSTNALYGFGEFTSIVFTGSYSTGLTVSTNISTDYREYIYPATLLLFKLDTQTC